MRIGIIHPELTRPGGAENLTLWLAAGLRDRGHEVTVAATGVDLSRWPEVDVSGVRVVDLPDRRGGFWHQPRRSRHHGRILAEQLGDADLMIAGNYPSYLWMADAVATLKRPPVSLLFCQEPRRKFYYPITDWPTVAYIESGRRTLPFHDWLEHGVRYRLRAHHLSKVPIARWRDRRRLPKIDAIIANSQFTKTNAARAWGRPTEACLLGAPATPDTMTSRSIEERAGVVVLTGWEVAKNPMGMLGAIAELVDRHQRRDIRFTIVGRGMIPQYEEYIRDRGLGAVMDVRGFVTEAEKHELLASARLCLFIPLAEPFGLVAAEAMLHGTPVVASNHGGPSEVVLDGETGVLVDPYDPGAIAASINGLYDDVSRLGAMSAAAQRRATEMFTFTSFLDRFEPLALDLVDRHAAKRSPHTR